MGHVAVLKCLGNSSNPTQGNCQKIQFACTAKPSLRVQQNLLTRWLKAKYDQPCGDDLMLQNCIFGI